MAASSFHRIEQLEARQMFAVSLDQGVLEIVGTKKADSITLTIESTTPDQVTVTINRFVRRFALSDIDSINIQAGQGDDFVQIDPGKNNLNQPTRMYGSGGVDTLIGGTGRDRIYGGSQSDRINGGSARDILYGEAGADRIDGGNHNDSIDGGDDNDTLNGNGGVDRIFGSDGDDTIDSVDGTADNVNGGPDVDTARADKIDDDLLSIEDIL
jgi:Ca2+-binding RTX toxin-like protein